MIRTALRCNQFEERAWDLWEVFLLGMLAGVLLLAILGAKL